MAKSPTTSDQVGTLLRKIATNTKEIADSNATLGDSATLDVGTTAGTVAAGDHNHTGVYATYAQGALADTAAQPSEVLTNNALVKKDSATGRLVASSVTDDGTDVTLSNCGAGFLTTDANGKVIPVTTIEGKILSKADTAANLNTTVLDGDSTTSELAWDKTLGTVRGGDGSTNGGKVIDTLHPELYTTPSEGDPAYSQPTGGSYVKAVAEYLEDDSAYSTGLKFATAAGANAPELKFAGVTDSFDVKGNGFSGSASNPAGTIRFTIPTANAIAKIDFSNISAITTFAFADGYVNSGYIRAENIKKLAAAFSKTNATLANVTGIVMIGLTAGKDYYIDANLFFTADSTGGIKLALTTSGTVTLSAMLVRVMAEGSDGTRFISTNLTSSGATASGTGQTSGYVRMIGTFHVDSSTNGDVFLQFAQSAANNSSQLDVGSTFRYTVV